LTASEDEGWARKWVNSYLARARYWMTGFDLKAFPTMGDSVAVWILHFLYPDRPVDREMLKKILAAVRAAHRFPGLISRDYDRVPAVTFCLLEKLGRRAEVAEDLESIQAVIEEIRRSSAGL